MKTLLLDRATWDLAVDAQGNIAVADVPYATAQDVSSAVRVFRGECWYNTALGLPYLAGVLGRNQSAALFRADVAQAALDVPNVARATCVLASLGADRKLSGQIYLTLQNGSTTLASF